MEESIYNIIPPKAVEQSKPPMFKSKTPKDLPPTASTFHTPGTAHPALSNVAGTAVGKVVKNKAHAEFGKPPGSYVNDPKSYMKKMAKTNSVPSLAEVQRIAPETLKPSHLKESRFKGCGGPPKKSETPVMNLVTSKNFVVANAVEVILAAPKKIPENTKDYLHKEDYGKVPKYLTHIKKDIEAEYEYIRQLQEQHVAENEPPIHNMPEEERLMLLDNLKARWEQVNTEYQSLTHMTVLDTVGKVRNKERCEAELSQIEKDLEKMNRKNIQIYTAN